VAHLAKYGRNSVARLSKHFERAKDISGNYVKFNNINIDHSRTPLNYNLAPDRSGGQVAFINQRLSEVRCLARSDVNIMCSWVITVPKDIIGTDCEKQFFQETYDFLKEKYGEENVISAYVHKDETTPHIHFTFVPVVKDKKRGDLKVSAKECITQNDLKTFHTKLDEYLKKNILGYTGGVTTGELKTRVNKEMPEYKKMTREIAAIGRFGVTNKSKVLEIGNKLVSAVSGNVVVDVKKLEIIKHKAVGFERTKEDIYFHRGEVVKSRKEIDILKGEVSNYKGLCEKSHAIEIKLSSQNVELSSKNVALKKLVHDVVDGKVFYLPEIPEKNFNSTCRQLEKVGCEYDDIVDRYRCFSISVLEQANKIIQMAVKIAVDFAERLRKKLEKEIYTFQAFRVCQGMEIERVESFKRQTEHISVVHQRASAPVRVIPSRDRGMER